MHLMTAEEKIECLDCGADILPGQDCGVERDWTPTDRGDDVRTAVYCLTCAGYDHEHSVLRPVHGYQMV